MSPVRLPSLDIPEGEKRGLTIGSRLTYALGDVFTDFSVRR